MPLSRDHLSAADDITANEILAMKLSDFVAKRMTSEARQQFERETREEKIEAVLRGEIEADAWAGAFWNAGILNDRSPLVRDSIKRALDEFQTLSPGMQNVALRSAFTLFPGEFREEIFEILPTITESKPFATGAYNILAANRGDSARIQQDIERIREYMITAFPDWKMDARLEALAHRLDVDPETEIAGRPDLADLLADRNLLGHPVIFSIQRLDRKHPGVAMVRGPDGRFVRDEKGGIFHIAHLAHSKTDLPGTISLGNTPRGIMPIRGAGYATNKFIGPVPYLYSKVPFEASVDEFFQRDAPTSDTWSREIYGSLLPESWRDYEPMYESWLAGKAGRSEMIVHGTTINEQFYRGTTYYPMTPSAGCLCAQEYWSGEDGRLIHSDQLALLKAFAGAVQGDEMNGYLVLVELDAQERRVVLEDVILDILAAEARLD